ncbi:hypothetical protein, partial [Paenibacillus arenosi]|uniref:hypothetical protein n=1 Tax=Paenibacillus arenosi TaxID=2774142 RepID=UPI001CDC3854
LSLKFSSKCTSLSWHSRSAPSYDVFILLALIFSVQLSVAYPLQERGITQSMSRKGNALEAA